MNSKLLYQWPDLLIMLTLAALEPFKTGAVYKPQAVCLRVCTQEDTFEKLMCVALWQLSWAHLMHII